MFEKLLCHVLHASNCFVSLGTLEQDTLERTKQFQWTHADQEEEEAEQENADEVTGKKPKKKGNNSTGRGKGKGKGRGKGGRGKGQGGRGKGKGKRPALQKSGKGKGKQRGGKRGGAAATDNPVTPARKRSVVDDEALSGPKTDNKEKKLRPPTEDVQVAPETNPGEAEHETPKKVAPKASQQPRKPAAKAKTSAKAKAAKTKAQATKAKKAKAKAKAKASRSKPLQSNSKPKQGAAATSKVKEDKLPKDKSEGKAQKEKSFARRWRPGAAKAGNHWQALRDVFDVHVRPHVEKASTVEDSPIYMFVHSSCCGQCAHAVSTCYVGLQLVPRGCLVEIFEAFAEGGERD